MFNFRHLVSIYIVGIARMKFLRVKFSPPERRRKAFNGENFPTYGSVSIPNVRSAQIDCTRIATRRSRAILSNLLWYWAFALFSSQVKRCVLSNLHDMAALSIASHTLRSLAILIYSPRAAGFAAKRRADNGIVDNSS